MNMIDILIIGVIIILLAITYILVKKTKKEGCSGACLGCVQEKTCRIKNFKEDYDNDNKS
ncbi:hypothetical protein [Anaerorhabdus sp.]|jgi:hypothetical protein|uniref:hypothetical protein n=1 Tax=Anaerorhabdus sp. TaxID=1872524 RepID=UPI002FC7D940